MHAVRPLSDSIHKASISSVHINAIGFGVQKIDVERIRLDTLTVARHFGNFLKCAPRTMIGELQFSLVTIGDAKIVEQLKNFKPIISCHFDNCFQHSNKPIRL